MEFPRLAIDARHIKTGIGAYTKNLILSLSAMKYGPIHLLTRKEFRGDFLSCCERISEVNAPIYSLHEQIAVPVAARKSPLLHVPHYNIPVLYDGRLLITIHDVTHLVFEPYGRSWKSRIYASPMLRLAARKADHIFTVSQYSKRRLIELFEIREDKVTVVYNGVGEQFNSGNRDAARERVALRHGIALPYVLYVGSLKEHKNIATLLRAYASLWAGKTPDASLVFVGTGDPGKAELQALADTLGVQPLFITDADDEQLVDLYRAAEVLVLPSFEEGFGLSIVEAMACGTPVICANAASLPEVAGEAAILFDPYDVDDLRGALDRVLSSPDLRSSLRNKGLVRATHFTWEKTAARHIPVYDRYQP